MMRVDGTLVMRFFDVSAELTQILYDLAYSTPAMINRCDYITARRYASVVLAVIVCLSVCHKSELYKDG